MQFTLGFCTICLSLGLNSFRDFEVEEALGSSKATCNPVWDEDATPECCKTMKLLEETMDINASAGSRHVAVRTLLFDLRNRIDLLKDMMQQHAEYDSYDEQLQGIIDFKENENLTRRLKWQLNQGLKEMYCWDGLGRKLLRLLPNNETYEEALSFAIESAKRQLKMHRYTEDVLGSAVNETWGEGQYMHAKFNGIMISMFLHWVITDIDSATQYMDEYCIIRSRMVDEGFIAESDLQGCPASGQSTVSVTS